MSDPVSALGGAAFTGFADIKEIGPLGMITLRAKTDAAGLQSAINSCVGTGIPESRQILHNSVRSAAWMGPDEYLLILPYVETDAAIAAITRLMAGSHHLAVCVSDARAMFRIEGAKADQVLAKIAPVDLRALQEGEMRRTRAAQVAAALWREHDGISLVCFRSVAQYVFDILRVSARDGSEL